VFEAARPCSLLHLLADDEQPGVCAPDLEPGHHAASDADAADDGRHGRRRRSRCSFCVVGVLSARKDKTVCSAVANLFSATPAGAAGGLPGSQPAGMPDFASMMGMMGGMPGMGALGGGVPPVSDPETAYATQIQQLVDMGAYVASVVLLPSFAPLFPSAAVSCVSNGMQVFSFYEYDDMTAVLCCLAQDSLTGRPMCAPCSRLAATSTQQSNACCPVEHAAMHALLEVPALYFILQGGCSTDWVLCVDVGSTDGTPDGAAEAHNMSS
jgi:hypothetical protein